MKMKIQAKAARVRQEQSGSTCDVNYSTNAGIVNKLPNHLETADERR